MQPNCLSRGIRTGALTLVLLASGALTATAASVCEPDERQESGSIYRICMPDTGYNGILILWAHGFQDAGTPVSIPENQLCTNGFCIPELVNSLGFGFATNSYSKTGLAILQGKDDLVDLVDIFAKKKGTPKKVYLIGASEGGIITALNLEQHPEIFSAGLATCGPVGHFPYAIDYFGDARATFEYFFPGVIGGDPFHPDPNFVVGWSDYYEHIVKPIVFNPSNRHLLDQWVAVARMPFDAANYLPTVEVSVGDALRYAVVNLNDAAATLGGFPYDNRFRWYFGSDNDFLLNGVVPRIAASPAGVSAMNAYNTTGKLTRPLITLHTLRDQQVPFLHEQIYAIKTFFAGSLLTRHFPIAIDRYGHCNFTQEEALFAFAVMLLYDGVLDLVSGTSSLSGPEQSSFERKADAVRLPYARAGSRVEFKLKEPK